jgi:hypothetical protein
VVRKESEKKEEENGKNGEKWKNRKKGRKKDKEKEISVNGFFWPTVVSYLFIFY